MSLATFFKLTYSTGGRYEEVEGWGSMRGRTFPFNLLDVFVVMAFVVVFFEFELFPRPALRATRHFRAFVCSVLHSHLTMSSEVKNFLPCSIFIFLRWSLQPFDDVPGQIFLLFIIRDQGEKKCDLWASPFEKTQEEQTMFHIACITRMPHGAGRIGPSGL